MNDVHVANGTAYVACPKYSPIRAKYGVTGFHREHESGLHAIDLQSHKAKVIWSGDARSCAALPSGVDGGSSVPETLRLFVGTEPADVFTAAVNDSKGLEWTSAQQFMSLPSR